MSRRRRGPLFGPEITSVLLPTSRPFLMVDHVLAFSLSPEPTIRTQRLISSNEPIFDGHFPALPMWPGVYTIEGLAQTAHLLFALTALTEGKSGDDPAETLIRELRAAAKVLRLESSDRAAIADMERLRERRGFGVLTGVDIKLEASVFAGDILEFEMSRGQSFADHHRVEAAAFVGGKRVAKGTLNVAERPLPVQFQEP